VTDENQKPDTPPCPFCGGLNPFAGAGDPDDFVICRVLSPVAGAPPAPPIDWTATTILASGDRTALGTREAAHYVLPFESLPLCEWLATVGDTGSHSAVFPAVAAALSGLITRAHRISDQIHGTPPEMSPRAARAIALFRATDCMAASVRRSDLAVADAGAKSSIEWIQLAIAYLLEAYEHATIETLEARHSAAH
jgi:hypothetical protein